MVVEKTEEWNNNIELGQLHSYIVFWGLIFLVLFRVVAQTGRTEED